MPVAPTHPPMPMPPTHPPAPDPSTLIVSAEARNVLTTTQLESCYRLTLDDYNRFVQEGRLRMSFQAMFDLAVDSTLSRELMKRETAARALAEAAAKAAAEAAAEAEAIAQTQAETVAKAKPAAKGKTRREREKEIAITKQYTDDLEMHRKGRVKAGDKQMAKLRNVRKMATGRGSTDPLQELHPNGPQVQPFIFDEGAQSAPANLHPPAVDISDDETDANHETTTGLEAMEQLGEDLNNTINNISNGNY